MVTKLFTTLGNLTKYVRNCWLFKYSVVDQCISTESGTLSSNLHRSTKLCKACLNSWKGSLSASVYFDILCTGLSQYIAASSVKNLTLILSVFSNTTRLPILVGVIKPRRARKGQNGLCLVEKYHNLGDNN